MAEWVLDNKKAEESVAGDQRICEEETCSRLYLANRVTIAAPIPNSLTLHALVIEVMNHTNSYSRILAILARWLEANRL